MEWSSLKGRGPRWFTVRKTTCFTKTWHFDSLSVLFFIFSFLFFYREFALVFFHSVRSGSVLYSILYSILCSLQNIFLVFCLFVRSLSSQLFFLVVLLLLLLRKTAFSFFSSKCDFFPLFFSEPSYTQLFSWVVVFWAVCRARIRSVASFFSSGLFFGLPVFRGSALSNLIYLVLLGGCSKALFSDSVDFSFSKGSFFLIFSGLFRGSSSPALFFFLVLFCLVLRI